MSYDMNVGGIHINTSGQIQCSHCDTYVMKEDVDYISDNLSPFINCREVPYSVIIKPSDGTFLE